VKVSYNYSFVAASFDCFSRFSITEKIMQTVNLLSDVFPMATINIYNLHPTKLWQKKLSDRFANLFEKFIVL